VAREVYGADDIIGDQKVRDRFKELQDQGYGHFPVCIAKTQYSFTTDPDKKGAPRHHVVPVREVRLSREQNSWSAICGDIMTMPGLPKIPSANKIDITPEGESWDCSDGAAAANYAITQNGRVKNFDVRHFA